MLDEFQKIQEICNKMSTKILKIDGEMPDEIELKVGNPQNSNSRNWANLSQPWNLTFFEDESFQLFFFNFIPQKYQNEKSPILNDQKKPKTSGKVQKIRVLEGLSSFRPFENTLYRQFFSELHPKVRPTCFWSQNNQNNFVVFVVLRTRPESQRPQLYGKKP